MSEQQKKEASIMSAIKPIQATPALSGEDAIKLMKQVLSKPSKSAINKNSMLINMLKDIRK